MKFVYLIVVFVTVLLSSCDGFCSNEYTVTNKSSKEILVLTLAYDPKLKESSLDSIKILPGKSMLVNTEELGICGFNEKPNCMYSDGDTILLYQQFDIFVADSLINELKLFNHWDFKTRPTVATYNLTITNDLLEQTTKK